MITIRQALEAVPDVEPDQVEAIALVMDSKGFECSADDVRAGFFHLDESDLKDMGLNYAQVAAVQKAQQRELWDACWIGGSHCAVGNHS